MIRFRRRVLFLLCDTDAHGRERSREMAAELARVGYEVTLIGPKNALASIIGEDSRAGTGNLTLLPFGQTLSEEATSWNSLRHFFWKCALVCRCFFTQGFDAVQAQSPDAALLIGLFFRYFFHKKIMMDYAGSQLSSPTRSRPVGFSLAEWLETKGLKTADVVLAANDSLAKLAMLAGKRKSQNVFVVRPVWLGKQAASQPAGIPTKKPPIFRVACGIYRRQARQTGLAEIIHAIRREHGREDIRFIAAGDAASLKALRKQAALVGLGDSLAIAEDNLRAIVREADLCVYACDAGESDQTATPELLLEAAAQGKPCVQYDGAEGRFTSGESSFYAPPGDTAAFARHILRLCDDDALRQAMGHAARSHGSQHFTWAVQSPRIQEAYEKLFHGMAEQLSISEERESSDS